MAQYDILWGWACVRTCWQQWLHRHGLHRWIIIASCKSYHVCRITKPNLKKARDYMLRVFFVYYLLYFLVFGFTAAFEFSTWFYARTNASRLYYRWATLVFHLYYCTVLATYLFDGWMDGCGRVDGVWSSRCPQILTVCKYLQTSLEEAAHSEVFILPYKLGESTVGFALECMLNELPTSIPKQISKLVD